MFSFTQCPKEVEPNPLKPTINDALAQDPTAIGAGILDSRSVYTA